MCIGLRACMRMSGNAGMNAIKYIYVVVCCLDCLVLLCPVVVVFFWGFGGCCCFVVVVLFLFLFFVFFGGEGLIGRALRHYRYYVNTTLYTREVTWIV